MQANYREVGHTVFTRLHHFANFTEANRLPFGPKTSENRPQPNLHKGSDNSGFNRLIFINVGYVDEHVVGLIVAPDTRPNIFIAWSDDLLHHYVLWAALDAIGVLQPL
jgi:hypothetical protein